MVFVTVYLQSLDVVPVITPDGHLGLEKYGLVGQREIADVIKMGERNRNTMHLLANWCAHARVERMGGGGIIEAQTGLPIGLRGVACANAPAGSVMGSNFHHSVIDFYDRNCSMCTQREPVGFPNITEIIAERDRAREEQHARQATEEARAAGELRLRQEERAALRSELDAVGRTILDDIGTYDGERSRENLERIVGVARMVPECFGDRLKDYVHSLAEREAWFTEVGVMVLHALDVDRSSVARFALRSFTRRGAGSQLVDIILDLVGHEDGVAAREALPALIDLASPDRSVGLGGSHRSDDRPLLALWPRHRDLFLKAVEEMLASRKRHGVEMAGRLLSTIQRGKPDAANTLARLLAATFARANLLIDDLEDENDPLPSFADTLDGIFESMPGEFDAILNDLAIGSDRKSAGRVQMVYARALNTRWNDSPVPADSRKHRIALSRLVWASTTLIDEHAIQTVSAAFCHMPENLLAVVRCEIEALLGASFLLADRVSAIDAEPRAPDESFLEKIERSNRRSNFTGLISNFLEWAASAAKGDLSLMDRIIVMMDTIPDGRDELRGYALGALQHFAEDVEGLRRFLPYLYHGLVGASVLVRSLAAAAVGELRSQARCNIPPLVFETFCVLLSDPYVIVHKAAVRALRRSSIPEEYRVRTAHALLGIVREYRTQSGESHFVADCVRLLAGMADEFGTASGAVRRYLIKVAMEVEPASLRSEIGSLAHTLGVEPSFGRLAARMLPGMVDRFNGSREVDTLLERLSPESIRHHAADFREAAILIARDDLLVSLRILERMSQSGVSVEAATLAAALVDSFDDNAHYRSRRLAARLSTLALEFEAAVADNDAGARQRIRQEWDETSRALHTEREEYRERSSRSGFPFAL